MTLIMYRDIRNIQSVLFSRFDIVKKKRHLVGGSMRARFLYRIGLKRKT